MAVIRLGQSNIGSSEPCFVIAEIGHNHQGSLETALKLVESAASCGVQAVKFQKRDNKTLYTSAMYARSYDNENSYGATYGEHREFLEFDLSQYRELKACADAHGVEFMSTAFDVPSVAFLEDVGVGSYKLASGDITNTVLIDHVARLNKPLFMSTGASTLDEIRRAYETARNHHDQICLLHCVAGYPTDYPLLNLRVIETLQREFPDAIIGYSGHDNGILASVLAYTMGARVIEKHFTLNRAWKGTDHKFSLEPEGMRKQVRDLRRADSALGDGFKTIQDFELDARTKMGKGVYAARTIEAGETISPSDVCLKSPANGVPPYRLPEIVGKTTSVAIQADTAIPVDQLT